MTMPIQTFLHFFILLHQCKKKLTVPNKEIKEDIRKYLSSGNYNNPVIITKVCSKKKRKMIQSEQRIKRKNQ